MSENSAPVIVRVTRGVVESEHLVDAVIIGADGPLIAAGDGARTVLPRSAIKPIQVLPLLETGAADHFDVSDDEIALGSASHSAQPEHVAAVDGWLHRIGLDRDALECGAGRPLSTTVADDLLRGGHDFEPIHNCCSGKHTAFLTVAQHLGHDPHGYIERDHPVQQLVAEALARYTGVDTTDLAYGIDGCGIPTFGFELDALARSMQRLVTSDDPAARRVSEALPGRALLLSGTDRQEWRVEAHATEPFFVKGGAEGVFMGALPQRGIGFALKARDGAERAANAALARLLVEQGAIDPRLLATKIHNRAGTVVGTTEAYLP